MQTPVHTHKKTRIDRVSTATENRLAVMARAIDALKIGFPVRLDGEWTMLAAETASEVRLRRIVGGVLVLTHTRAQTLKIRLYTPEVVALPLAADARKADIDAIVDPTADLATPLKGPFETLRDALPAAFAAGVKLAKLAGLLPAAILFRSKTRALRVPLADIPAYDRLEAESTRLIVQAHVPLEGAESAVLAAFRGGGGGPEHFALVIGHPSSSEPVLTRIHSECFTGDLLGSLKCDCGQQLRGAVAAIAKAGGGVLLYLAQEGRGIGIVNKLRAYTLQDQGFDTIEANERLGFEADERLYLVAARMLRLLGFSAVRLLTNNPDKVAALTAAGIAVVERVPHAFARNPHNEAYLRTKALKAGHWL
jgi:GTP cyclohydrolase II